MFSTTASLRLISKQMLSFALHLNPKQHDATMIIVAQRVSTIMDANQIIVLDEGRIAGIGTHSELMKTCEVYQEIVASQLSEEESA